MCSLGLVLILILAETSEQATSRGTRILVLLLVILIVGRVSKQAVAGRLRISKPREHARLVRRCVAAKDTHVAEGGIFWQTLRSGMEGSFPARNVKMRVGFVVFRKQVSSWKSYHGESFARVSLFVAAMMMLAR